LRSRNLLFLLGALLIVAGVLAGPAQAQSSAGLFDDGDAVSPRIARDAGGPRVLRARTTRLRVGALDSATSDGLAGVPAPLLELNLFPDAALRAVFERIATDRFGHRTWVGRIVGDPLSTVTLTWRDGTIVGGVQTADTVYRVQGTMDAAVIEQVDPASFGEEREPVAVEADALTISPASPPPVAADGEVADILVYYTPAARTAQGGTAAIEALIATAIADANTAYGRSGVAATLRLAAAVELTGYTESADMSNDLAFLRTNGVVAATRNSVGADLVALIVASSTGGACGIGYLGPSVSAAHSVTARTCIVGNYTFAHEVGHNLGSHHAPEDGASGAWRSYGYGYKDYTANFRTVMAYAPGTRILNFSNPEVLHNGRVTGSATQRNALSLREAFPIVQAFRSAVPAGGAPGAPVNLAATVSGTLVSLSWQAPATGMPTAYILHVGTAPGVANLFAGSVGLATSVSAPLPAGVYYARVYATNGAGTGPASPEVTMNVGIGLPPGPPQGLAGSVSGSTVSVTWAPPLSGGAVTSYVAQVGTSPGAANVFNAAVGVLTAASGSLGPGTYYVRIRAQNAAGLGAASNEFALTVGPSCTVPASPVLTGSTSGGTITIQWTTPLGGPMSGYTVQAGSVSGASNLFNASVGLVNAVSAPVGPGVYYIRVLANTACGRGPASNQVSVTVP
jgi:hypothetical protein